MMGTQQTWGGITRVVFPLIAGFAFQHFGPPFPFWISAAVVLVTLFLGAGMEHFARDAEAARAA